MEYIKEKGKGISMQIDFKNFIKIHETMTEGVHYKFSTHGPDVVSHTLRFCNLLFCNPFLLA